MTRDTDLAEREERLGELFGEWLESLERGEVPDRQQWLARHPEFAADLEELFTDEERLHALAGPLRAAAQAALLPTPTPARTPVPAGPDGGPPGPAGPTPGTFGDYELLEEIGRGGMGVVYRARQRSLGRLVALKLFRDGPLDGGDLRRFRHEAEVVAQLDHPRVVPIYEVGEHQGRVYFSMKLVEGGGLDACLDRFRANPPAAAGLVAAVARAVHHAHQRGILHRDLKPANILLDRDGRPHVTDFGLAKRVGVELGLTRSGAMVGTPAYMAPEQAAGRRGAVTTATDVYGLGALLYALLTGKAPFHGASVLETLEQVKARDPEPPGRCNPRVPRDLETVCLKCLHKEPARRYESAAALADDLGCWLRGEPIQARPVGPPEWLWLWCRRQPVPAALGAALLLAVAVGLPLVVWQWQRAEDHYRTSEGHRREAVTRAAEAEDRFRLAHQVVKDFTTQVGDPGVLEAHDLDPLRRDLLLKAEGYYQKFLERRGHDPALRREQAQAVAGLADIVRQTRAPEDALAVYGRALALYEELLAADPDNPALLLEQARGTNNLGDTLGALGRRDEALDTLRRAEAVLGGALRAWPEDARLQDALVSTHLNRAKFHQAAGRDDAALASLTEARRILDRLLRARPDQPEFLHRHASTLEGTGLLLARRQRWAEALKNFREAAAVRDRLSKRFPGNFALRARLADSLTAVGNCLRGQGHLAESREALGRARAIREDVTRASPDVPEYRDDPGNRDDIRAPAQAAGGDPGRALESIRQAGAAFRHLADEQPGFAGYRLRPGSILSQTAPPSFFLTQEDLALAASEEARDILVPLVAAHPDRLDLAGRLAMTLHNLALLLGRRGRFEDARSALVQAEGLQRRVFDGAAGNAESRLLLGGHCFLLAQVECDLGRPDRAADVLARLLGLWPDNPQALYAVARDFALAVAFRSKPAARQRCADLALDALRRAVQAGFRDPQRARTDPALQALWERDDFRELLAAMSTAPDGARPGGDAKP
jgi:serine/threonine-protein kinase